MLSKDLIFEYSPKWFKEMLQTKRISNTRNHGCLEAGLGEVVNKEKALETIKLTGQLSFKVGISFELQL